MHAFVDTKGRTWNIPLTIDAVKRVKSLLQGTVDLLNPAVGDPPLLTRLDTDIELLVNVIWAIVEPQAKALQVGDAEFGECLGGAAIAAAHDAFFEELADFFRLLRRPDVALAIDKQTAVVRKAVAMAQARMDAIDPEAVTQAAFATPGRLSTNSPGSPA